MKKIEIMMIGTMLVVWGASVLAQSQRPGLARSGQYRRSASVVSQPDSSEQSSDAIYSVGSYTLNTPELAQGKGRELVNVYCQICHSATYITMQPPLPAATWEAVVNKMVTTHGAAIPGEAAKQIIAYLQANYTTETRKQ
jgi:cytochrome c5